VVREVSGYKRQETGENYTTTSFISDTFHQYYYYDEIKEARWAELLHVYNILVGKLEGKLTTWETYAKTGI